MVDSTTTHIWMARVALPIPASSALPLAPRKAAPCALDLLDHARPSHTSSWESTIWGRPSRSPGEAGLAGPAAGARLAESNQGRRKATDPESIRAGFAANRTFTCHESGVRRSSGSRDRARRRVVLSCERCGTSFSEARGRGLGSCPRCGVRDVVRAQLAPGRPGKGPAAATTARKVGAGDGQGSTGR
jgi:transcription elongation factor Elf1